MAFLLNYKSCNAQNKPRHQDKLTSKHAPDFMAVTRPHET